MQGRMAPLFWLLLLGLAQRACAPAPPQIPQFFSAKPGFSHIGHPKGRLVFMAENETESHVVGVWCHLRWDAAASSFTARSGSYPCAGPQKPSRLSHISKSLL